MGKLGWSMLGFTCGFLTIGGIPILIVLDVIGAYLINPWLLVGIALILPFGGVLMRLAEYCWDREPR